ncbi:MAG: group 1 truncated hemoglobin [Bdellovibrionales bacterium]|nr:group 1 truncated hemoglobin [Bdellovibrionales bacterium]
MAEEQTLYDALGGKTAIEKLITTFYEKVVDDERIGKFFQGKDVQKIRAMQIEFFGAALDGPIKYTGLEIARVHSGLGISRNDFNRYVQILLQTLDELGVSSEHSTSVIDRINLYVDDVVGKGGIDG